MSGTIDDPEEFGRLFPNGRVGHRCHPCKRNVWAEDLEAHLASDAHRERVSSFRIDRAVQAVLPAPCAGRLWADPHPGPIILDPVWRWRGGQELAKVPSS